MLLICIDILAGPAVEINCPVCICWPLEETLKTVWQLSAFHKIQNQQLRLNATFVGVPDSVSIQMQMCER